MPPWVTIVLRLFSGVLVTQGKKHQAEVLTDALAAIKNGKNVDTTMLAYAQKWEAEGEPNLVDITATRKEIQARIGGGGDGGG